MSQSWAEKAAPTLPHPLGLDDVCVGCEMLVAVRGSPFWSCVDHFAMFGMTPGLYLGDKEIW